MLKDFIDSIKSISEYGRFKQKKLIKVIVYLLIISLFAGMIFATAMQRRYSEIISLLPENYDSKFPDFKIEDGVLTLDNTERVVIEKDKTAIIFDTSSSADENALSKYKKGALLLEDRIIIKTSQLGKMEKKWSDIFRIKLDKQMLRDYLGVIPILMILLTVFSMVGLVFINIIASLVIALTFTLIKKFWKKKFSFMEVFKMTVHSLTLPMVLIAFGSSFIGDLLSLKYYFYLYYVSIIYLIIAINRTDLLGKVGNTDKNRVLKYGGNSKKKQS